MTYSKLLIGQLVGALAAHGLRLQSLLSVGDTAPWIGHNWLDSASGIGVKDGIPYGNNADTERMITSPQPLEGDVTDYMTKENVKLVASFLDEATFNGLFPERKDVYTYEGFLQAIGKFPALCGENNTSDSDLIACKTELATIFAHFAQETGNHSPWDNDHGTPYFKQGLSVTHENGCPATSGAGCDYIDESEFWPAQSGQVYYGRGPFQLSYNENYGQFSTAFLGDKMVLLKDPDQVMQDSYTIFAAALWFYMTPQSPKPSIHDVTIGYFTPSSDDEAAGIKGGFGTTINIINGARECRTQTPGVPLTEETTQAKNRVEYYKDFLNFFSVDTSNLTNLGCMNMGAFDTDSSSFVKQYFTKGTTDGECELSQDPGYSMYTPDDYKRCVCDSWDSTSSSCPQA